MDIHIVLQWVLFISVFIIGALTTLAIDHFVEHRRTKKAEPKKPSAAGPATVSIPPAIREQLLQTAQNNFQKVMEKSAIDLQRDLGSISDKLNRQLEKLGSDIVNSESERYRKTIEALRKQAETTIKDATADVNDHQTDINTKLTERQAELEENLRKKLADEQALLIKQIDTKLSDAVISFLTETMQHNVDLGSQSDYLVAMLEEHKDELKKEAVDEV